MSKHTPEPFARIGVFLGVAVIASMLLYAVFCVPGCSPAAAPHRDIHVVLHGFFPDTILQGVRDELARCGIGLFSSSAQEEGLDGQDFPDPCAPHVLRRFTVPDAAVVALSSVVCPGRPTARAYTNRHYGVTIIAEPNVLDLGDTLLHELGHHLGVPDADRADLHADGVHCDERGCVMQRASSSRFRGFGPLCCEDLQ